MLLAIICRSHGADRDLDAGSYKDFAPTEHDLGLPNVQTAGLANSDVLVKKRYCKRGVLARYRGVLARYPFGDAGGDARATFFACRRSWFSDGQVAQESSLSRLQICTHRNFAAHL